MRIHGITGEMQNAAHNKPLENTEAFLKNTNKSLNKLQRNFCEKHATIHLSKRNTHTSSLYQFIEESHRMLTMLSQAQMQACTEYVA